MTKAESYKPKRFHTVTPGIIVDDAPRALSFYAKAFGAKELSRDLGPGGKVWHAEIQIGDSLVMVSDEFPEMGGKSAKTLGDSPGGLWMYVEDADSIHHRAVAAGAKSIQAPADQFWGDRIGMVEDPFGHTWTIATHKEDLTPAEIDKRRQEALRAMAGGRPSPA
jgi:PhnB protein